MNIKESPSGLIFSSPKGYNAFIPHPLPPEIGWNTDLVNALSRADFLIGKLSKEGQKLPNPHLLMRPFITREAVLSSKIEGTRATVGEVLAHDAGIKSNTDSSDILEVQNYVEALDYGLKRLRDLPLSLRLIRELHKHLMQDVSSPHVTPGAFRKTQNWIGTAGCTLNTAKFVPPPVENLMDCLGKLERFLHNQYLPPLIHIALCHYQFEAIHPFIDGNGRVGRLLITMLLIERGILPAPLLYLSAFFEATRKEYYGHLFNVSAKGSWNEWLIYFLNGVSVQTEDVLSRAERINTLLNKWKLKMAKFSSHVPVEIVDLCAVNPYVSVNQVSSKLNIAYSTAQRGIQHLLNAQILSQINESKRDRMYCARDILNILEEPTVLKPMEQSDQ